MKVKNGDIWQAREPLQGLLKEAWPVKTAYWLAKLARKIGEHHRDIDQTRVKLIQQYGTANEQGSIEVKAGDENWERFAAEFNELMDVEVELENIDKIVLPNAEGVAVTPAAMLLLEPFVEVA